jgi:hydrogenase maturation protease
MNLEPVEQIAEAVLYEGYMLYPYRPSAVKNQQRFNFGVLCPPSYCEMHPGAESHFMQTECLFKGTPSTRLTIRIRFLQIVQRSVARYIQSPCPPSDDCTAALEYVDRLEADGRVYHPWQEAAERSITYEALNPAELSESQFINFTIPGESSIEDLTEQGCAGAIVRESQSLTGVLHFYVEHCRDNVMKLAIYLENRSAFHASAIDPNRDAALPHSLVSAHIILGIENGEFVSLLDPPAAYADLARGCNNIGNWPVLVGDEPTAILASPIILYDYPKIAPESAGNLFDSTEIDEILSLRILTLTEQEKAEIRQSDDRARALLDRTESIPDEEFMKLHGILRGMNVMKEGHA